MRRFICSLLLSLLVFSVSAAMFADTAPLSEKYLQYLRVINTPLERAFYGPVKTAGGWTTGAVPAAVIPEDGVYKGAEDFPSSYSLVDLDRVTPVKDQNPYGTCWAFAALSSVETAGITELGEKKDYSVLNIIRNTPFNVTLNSGGNWHASGSYFVNLLGPVLEMDDPYSSIQGGKIPPLASEPVRQLTVKDIDYLCDKILVVTVEEEEEEEEEEQQASFKKEPGDLIYSIDQDKLNSVKNAVMKHGSVQISYQHDDSYYFERNCSYFAPEELTNSGHGVSVVGWDDNYPAGNFYTVPEGDGAFLVKNSWGENWGKGGYYWISYYDRNMESFVNFHNLSNVKDEYMGIITNCTGFGFSAHVAKKCYVEFTANDDCVLRALSTEVFTPATCAFQIYVNGNQVADISKEFDYAGSHVLKLSSISINKGDTIRVYGDYAVDGAQGDYFVPIETNAGGIYPHVIASGKNYFYVNGQYTSLAYNIAIRLYTKFDTFVKGVSLKPAKLTLETGVVRKLTATVSPSTAENKAVKWTSSDPSVASVDQRGRITTLAAGKTTITVKTKEGGFKAKCKLTVVDKFVHPESISLNKTAVTLEKGKTVKLKATITPSDVSDKTVKWASSDNFVASVDSNGLVTALTPGKATVTVTTKDGGLVAACKITVQSPPDPVRVSGVSIGPSQLVIRVGESQALKASFKPANATNKNVTWSSLNTKIAVVDENGVVTGVKNGTTFIKVKTEDGSKTATARIIVRK